MSIYQFTYVVPAMDDDLAEGIAERCPDTLTGCSNGTCFVAFDREADSLEAALRSALADLRGLGIAPLRVEMDAETELLCAV